MYGTLSYRPKPLLGGIKLIAAQILVSEKPLMHLQARIVLIYYSHSDPMGTEGQTMISSSKKSSNFMSFEDLIHQECASRVSNYSNYEQFDHFY
jgi:hypothetical protein